MLLACTVEARAKFAVLDRVKGVAKSSAQAALLDKLASLIETGEAFTVKQQPAVNCTDCGDDEFCKAICLFIGEMPGIEKFITDAETATIGKIDSSSSTLKAESDQASSDLNQMKDDDEEWALCTREAYDLAITADSKHLEYLSAKTERENACNEPYPEEYSTWDVYYREIDIPVFACDLAVTGVDSCENKMNTWQSTLTGRFNSVTTHLDICIDKHGAVLIAHGQRDAAYGNHANKRGNCTTYKSNRDHSCEITFPNQMEKYCGAKTDFDILINDVKGSDNIDSMSDRIQECEGVRALDCVMREVIDALTDALSSGEDVDFELNSTVLQICQNRAPYTDCVDDFTLSEDELKADEYANSTSAIACDSQTVSGLAYAYVYNPTLCNPHPYVNGTSCYTNTTNRNIDVVKADDEFSTDCTP